MSISLVSGWLPIVVILLAAGSLVVSLDWRDGRWRRQLLIGVPVSLAITGALALVLSVASIVPADFPVAAFAWGFVVVLATEVAVTGWSREAWWHRTVGIGAVVLLAAITVGSVNAHADAYPTIGRLFDVEPEHVVENAQLAQIRAQVAKSGHLPTNGVVITETIPSPVSHFATRPAYIYLPPAWFAKVTPFLPTLVLLPGEPGSAADWSGPGDADVTADAFAAGHDGVAPIIVMPDPDGFKTVDSECVDSRFGNAETYLVDDVPAFARSRFNASTKPGSLAIGGLSAGGTCSVMLALRHPQVYPTFASFSGFASPQYEETSHAETVTTLFGGSESAFLAHDPIHLLETGQFDGLAGWFEVGDQDQGPLEAAHRLQPAAERAGIATCILVRPGGHDFDLWSQALEDAFPWLSWRLGLTAEPAHEPARCSP